MRDAVKAWFLPREQSPMMREVELEVFTRQDTAGAWDTWVCRKGHGHLEAPSYWEPTGSVYTEDRWMEFHGDCLGHHYSLSRLGNATIGHMLAMRKAKKELKRRLHPPARRTDRRRTIRIKL